MYIYLRQINTSLMLQSVQYKSEKLIKEAHKKYMTTVMFFNIINLCKSMSEKL